VEHESPLSRADAAVPGGIARWRVFSAAPHRMLFSGGAVQLTLTMALWLAELAARAAGAALPFTQPSPRAHGFLMIYGLFPFFIFGFLLTVYPRWMTGAVVPAARYVPIFLLLAGGMLLFYPGLFVSRYVSLAGVLSYLTGWVLALYTLFGVYRRARARGSHELVLNLALTAGALGLSAYAYGLLTESAWAYRLARETGLWLLLVPVLFTVSHRMIPFFSGSVLAPYTPVRPSWSLPLMGICVVGHAALELSGLVGGTFVFDLPLAATAVHHTFRWNLRRSLEVRLLAMLHIAFAWLGIGLMLYALQSLALLAGLSPPARAPLHALAIGFVAGMAVAMAARVTLGHSGRELTADALTWYAFLGVNVVALLRIAAEFWHGPAGHALNYDGGRLLAGLPAALGDPLRSDVLASARGRQSRIDSEVFRSPPGQTAVLT
jgi:uncharacterized protein involved in response to NO